MKFPAIGLLFILLLLLDCLEVAAQPEWKKKYDDPKAIRGMFQNPPMFYAPHTFWFWDDTIRNENFAASMAEEMAKQRLNPGYVHPRSSMERLNSKYPSLPYEQYLEEPWFSSFGNTLDKAKKYGLTLGYCDDYDWPSGQAAGRVLKQHPELEAKYLDLKRHEIKGKSTVKYDSIDFAIAAKLFDGKIDASTLRLIGEGNSVTWTAPDGDWVVYTYKKKFHSGVDGGRVNYLDPKLMKVFIPIVHEKYARRFSNDMGKSIPGVFVDNEGDYGWQMAWSEYLAERYSEIKNRDIRLWLPLLTEKDKDGLFVKARYDWFDVISDVYIECFFEPLVNWLKKYNMYYISNLWEESLLLQTAAVGDLMRVNRAVTMPGTDCLLMRSQEVHDFKEVQTVAELEDRPFMSEIMGVAGWVQTPEMLKMTINSITSFGVNHVVPHGIYLNRRIETNPYPADWFTENPYWPYLHNWTDFSRRASFVTRQSELVADVLLVNPLESIWACAEGMFSHESLENRADWGELPRKINQVYSDAMQQMNANNIDFLIADRYYLGKGMVESDNKITRLVINDHRFSALVLPPTTIISHFTSNKILEFAKAGGVVVILGELPKGSPENGEKDPRIIQQMDTLRQLPTVVDLASENDRMKKFVSVLNERIAPQIRLENSGRLYTAHRKIADKDFYWFANNADTIRNFSAWLRDGSGTAEVWNCETGEITAVVSTKEQGYNKVMLSLQPYEAYWLVFNTEGKTPVKVRADKRPVKEVILNGEWQLAYPASDTIYRTSAKALFSEDEVLQEAKVKPGVNDSAWKYSSFIFEPSRDASQLSDMETKLTHSYWRIIIPAGSKAVIFPADMPKADIWIDGKKARPSDRSLDLPNDAHLLSFAIQKGGDKLPGSPLKFVIGDTIKRHLQNWYQYGLDQYTGYVDYETTIKTDVAGSKVSIDLGNVKYMAEVFVNDRSVGSHLWPPFLFDISSGLKKGQNKIRVRIGNLMVSELWMRDDMRQLRTWGWTGTPYYDDFDAGLIGPVKLLIAQ